MRKVYQALLLFAVYFGFSARGLSQKILYPEINPINERFDNFLIKDGAASQASTAIIFDRKGFLWSGTETGLYRFDGTNYIEYRNNEIDSTGYSGNNILTLFEDSEGYLWVGTVGALNRLDPASGFFRHFTPDPLENPPVNNIIRLIREDAENDLLWIITNGNIFSFDKSTEIFTEYKTDPSAWLKEWDVLWESPDRFLIDRYSNKWFATQYGLYCFNNHDREFHTVFPESGSNREEENTSVVSVCEDSSGTIWFGTNGGSLLKLKPGDPKPERVDFSRSAYNLPGFNSISTVKADLADRIWIFGDKVFSIYDPEGQSTKTYRISFGKNDKYRLSESEILINQAFFLPDSTVWFFSNALGIMYRFDPRTDLLSLYRVPAFIVHNVVMDKTGFFWFACVRNNIYRLTISNVPYYSIPINNSSWVGAASRSKITSDHLGQVWLSISGGTFKLLTLDNFFSPGIEKIRSIGRDSIFASIYMDSRKRIWFGGRKGQVVCKYPVTGNLIRYQLTHSALDIQNDAIRKILEDPEGNIWAVAVSSGLYRFSDSSGKFDHVLDYKNLPDQKFPELSDFLIGNYGELWMLNYKGVYQLKSPGSVISTYSGTESKNSLQPGDYNRIRKDLTGNVWLLNGLGGVFKYISEQDSFSPVRISKESPSSFFDLVTDSLNRLWVANDRGITIYNPVDNTSRTISMPRLQHDVQGYLVPGHIVYINENKLFVFDLDVPVNTIVPDVYFTGLKINGEYYYKVTGINEDVRSLREINLKHKYNSLRIEFCAISYIDPDNNTYRYYMKGVDNDTVFSGRTNFSEYKKLRPGGYTFWVSGANNDGIWNKEGMMLNINIKPAFYATTSAKIIYFLFSIMVITLYIRLRISSIRKENIRLESVVKQRTAELQLRNRQLQDMDNMKTKFFTDISHEIRTPLSLIIGPLESLAEENQFDQKTGHLMEIMKRNGQRLLQLVNQMLDISRLDSGKMKLALSETDLTAFMNLHVYEYVSLAESKNIKYMVELPENPYINYFDQDKLEKIINNLLSNAFKFTGPGGNISCTVKIIPGKQANIPDKVVIKVEDTGKGIDSEDFDRIFDRFYRAESDGESPEDGTGIGLSLTRELIELNHGNIEVKSWKGKGSVFEVTIPLGKDHLGIDEFIIIHDKMDAIIEGQEIKKWKEIEPDTCNFNQDSVKNAILIVEDHDDLRKYIEANLEKVYRIFTADTGKTGINLAFTHTPDLIVTDIMMRDIDGFILCEKLKNDERTSHIPIIMLTAKATSEDRIKGLKLGADDYLIKPFNMAELKTRIANLLELREKIKLKYSNLSGIRLDKYEKESVDERFMRKVLSIINENLRDFNFSVGKLQVKLGMSRTHLVRKLKVLTGMSPVVLIRNIRLEKAALLLESKSGNIIEIANSVGISNPSYFTKTFREYFGVSPRDYYAGKRLKNKPTLKN